MKSLKFTLLELLVVIDIIGIIKIIPISSLSQARVKARQAICMKNQAKLRQLFLHMQLITESTAPLQLGK